MSIFENLPNSTTLKSKQIKICDLNNYISIKGKNILLRWTSKPEIQEF